MGKIVAYIIVGIVFTLMIVYWVIDNNDNTEEMERLTKEFNEKQMYLSKKYDSVLEVNIYLTQKAKDKKKELNETKTKISEVQVVDYTTIHPDARADSIRAIINR